MRLRLLPSNWQWVNNSIASLYTGKFFFFFNSLRTHSKSICAKKSKGLFRWNLQFLYSYLLNIFLVSSWMNDLIPDKSLHGKLFLPVDPNPISVKALISVHDAGCPLCYPIPSGYRSIQTITDYLHIMSKNLLVASSRSR